MADILTTGEWSPDEAQAIRWSNGTAYVDPVKNADNGIEVHVNNQESNPVIVTVVGAVSIVYRSTADVDFYCSGVVALSVPISYRFATVAQWTLPAGVMFHPTSFAFYCEEGGGIGRMGEEVKLASWSVGGGFTKLFTSTTTERWREVRIKVLTTFASGGSNVILNIDYKDETGAASTSVMTIARGSMADGDIHAVIFDPPDYGLREITNITNSGGQSAGAIEITGFKEIAQSNMGGGTGGDSYTQLAGIKLQPERLLSIEATQKGTGTIHVRGAITGYYV